MWTNRNTVASYIVPWREAADEERLDVENGILLSPLESQLTLRVSCMPRKFPVEDIYMEEFEGKTAVITGGGLFRAEGEIAELESSRVDVPIEVLNTYVGLYEFENSALKTLQVKLQGNDLEIGGTDANGTVLFVDKMVTLGPNEFAVDKKGISVRFIIENNEVVGMESNQEQVIPVSRRIK